jgi:hypothetical protein
VGRESSCSSGGCAAALSERRQCNVCTAVLLGREGGEGHAAVLVRQQRGLSVREGWQRQQVTLRSWCVGSVVVKIVLLHYLLLVSQPHSL